MRRRAVFLLLLLAAVWLSGGIPAHGEEQAGKRKTGFQLTTGPARELVWDEYEKRYVRSRSRYSIGGELLFATVPSDSDAFAVDYGWPTLSVGVRYDFNHGVSMHRESDEAWPLLQPVDYVSHMGNVVTLYGKFSRPLLRTRYWEADYALSIGAGYSRQKYNTHDNIDNELIGSRWLIYFGAGVHATWRVAPEWGLRGGLEFWHHSNGALNRPNKGANALGPSVALVYYSYYGQTLADTVRRVPFVRRWYADVAVGIGGKTLLEEWQRTQFKTAPGDPDYRTSRFHLYAAYSVQASLMYRYARRWASGVGADVCYGTYADRADELQDGTDHVSPWSLGLSARHEVFYHRLSLAMSLGCYVYRHMGSNAREAEKPYYEYIGLRYSIPHAGGLYVGGSVKAHLTKADLTEFVVGKRF